MNAALPAADPSQPTVALILITHRRERLFRQALDTLVAQDAPKDRYEVIVVDNDTTPNEAVRAATEAAGAHIRTRYIFESKLGVSNARNAGGRAARANYFALFDDDAKAPPDYVSRLLRVAAERRPDIFGGPIHPFYESPRPAWFKDAYEIRAWGPEARVLLGHETLSGANIVFRQGLLDETGWFDPLLSKRGRRLWFGGETQVQLQARARRPDATVWYDPNLIVYHLTPAEKMRLPTALKTQYNLGRSLAYLWIPPEQWPAQRRRGPRALLGCIVRLLRHLPPTLWSHRTPGPYWQNYVFEVLGRDLRRLGGAWRLTADWLRPPAAASVPANPAP